MSLILSWMPGRYAVCQLPPDEPLPDWATSGRFFNVTRAATELSVVCEADLVPEGVRAERGWRTFVLHGPFPFDLTGILASVAVPLAEAGVGIFALSTFDTDYVLVKEENARNAQDALESAGHTFRE